MDKKGTTEACQVLHCDKPTRVSAVAQKGYRGRPCLHLSTRLHCETVLHDSQTLRPSRSLSLQQSQKDHVFHYPQSLAVYAKLKTGFIERKTPEKQ